MAAAVDRPRPGWARSCSSRLGPLAAICRIRCTRPCSRPSLIAAVRRAPVLPYACRFPSHDEAIRRIERVSGIPHRPASSYEDTITANADDPRTAAIWQAHRARLAAALARLKVGKPHPRADRDDPIALRGLLVLGVVAAAGAGRRQRLRPLRSAFRFNSAIALSEARLDAWVTPPSYTGQAAVDAGRRRRGPAAATAQPKLVEVPERSVLIVRTSGRVSARLRWTSLPRVRASASTSKPRGPRPASRRRPTMTSPRSATSCAPRRRSACWRPAGSWRAGRST